MHIFSLASPGLIGRVRFLFRNRWTLAAGSVVNRIFIATGIDALLGHSVSIITVPAIKL
jgi:hypothetical protein